MSKGGFIFANQFLQISAEFNGKIYGLGEHESPLQLNTSWNRFTMFNHDSIPWPNVRTFNRIGEGLKIHMTLLIHLSPYSIFNSYFFFYFRGIYMGAIHFI